MSHCCWHGGADHGGRSRLIDAAVNFYLGHRKQAQLRDELRLGALARATRDQEIATELFDFTESWGIRQA